MVQFGLRVFGFGLLYFLVYRPLFWAAVAIGDSAHPTLSLPHGLTLTVLNFPMMYLTPWGDALKPSLGDNGTILLFTAINAILWGLLLSWVSGHPWSRIIKRRP
jgi:hypothetical protein